MIENANDKPQSLLKAESDLEKAKHRLEEEKKNTNEKQPLILWIAREWFHRSKLSVKTRMV